MRLRVLVVPDKFKGTLTAAAAARHIRQGWRAARPEDQLDLLPMSDGGDGFGEVMSALLGADRQKLQTVDAAGRLRTEHWWWERQGRTAVIETARVIGLARLPPGQCHPFDLDTYGLGKVMQAAANKGARRCVVGLGGSATNDGGFGLARSLGWKFLDAAGNSIDRWIDLPSVVRLAPPVRRRWPQNIVVAVDVQNQLLGGRGASRVYGPQKGLRPSDFPLAERCLKHLAILVRQQLHRDLARCPGAGAAGGLGFGFLAFLGGHIEAGFSLFSKEARLATRIRRADLVITGEGSIDRSTFMGKGAGCVAGLCSKLGVPCIGLAGAVDASMSLVGKFSRLCGLTELTTSEAAKAEPAKWLRQLAKRVANDLANSPGGARRSKPKLTPRRSKARLRPSREASLRKQ